MTTGFEIIKTLIEVVIVPAAGFYMRKLDNAIDGLGKELSKLMEAQNKQNTELAVLKVALIGIDGRNGIRSEVAALKAHQENK